jgi:hypothetical protein
MFAILARSSHAYPKTDAPHWLSAIWTGNFKQTPECGQQYDRDEERKYDSDCENSRRIPGRDAHSEKKSNGQHRVPVIAPYQVLADRHPLLV